MAAGLPGAVSTTEPRSIGLWLRENFPPDTTMAQVATGIIPYYSRLPVIDMLGVNDEHIAHLDVPLGIGPAGHEKTDGAYVISRQPDIIWLMLGVDLMARTSIEHYMPPYWGRGWDLADQILLNGYIWDLYEPIAIPYEGGGYLNLLVHRNTELPAADRLFIPIAD
jgi:hypothetical protein